MGKWNPFYFIAVPLDLGLFSCIFYMSYCTGLFYPVFRQAEETFSSPVTAPSQGPYLGESHRKSVHLVGISEGWGGGLKKPLGHFL